MVLVLVPYQPTNRRWYHRVCARVKYTVLLCALAGLSCTVGLHVTPNYVFDDTTADAQGRRSTRQQHDEQKHEQVPGFFRQCRWWIL